MANLDPSSGDPLGLILGIKGAHIIAGLAGGIVRAMTTSQRSLSRGVTISIAGAITAGWCTPTVAPIVTEFVGRTGYPTAGIEGSVGFGLGLIGLSLTDLAIGWVRRWLDRTSPPPAPPK